MGECNYYLRGHWPTPEAAAEAAPKVEAFLKSLAAAEQAWLESRSGSDLALVLDDHPGVLEALGMERPEAESDGLHLAGDLSGPYGAPGYQFLVDARDIKVSAEVWHMASWEALARALRVTFGAEASGWLSEDNAEVDYFDLVDMERAETEPPDPPEAPASADQPAGP